MVDCLLSFGKKELVTKILVAVLVTLLVAYHEVQCT
jgi:hypothetical protein